MWKSSETKQGPKPLFTVTKVAGPNGLIILDGNPGSAEVADGAVEILLRN
jgi:hypothetical protein